MASRKNERGPEPNTFGWRLREARRAARLSPQKIATRMGVGISTYYSWEANARSPRKLERLATVTRTSVGALYGERAA